MAASKILPQPKVRKFKGNRRPTRSMQFATRFTHRRLFPMRREWNFCGAASTEYKWNLELRRHRHHLARRLHYPRKIPESDRRSLQARRESAQSPARPLFHRASSKEHSTTGASRFRPRLSRASLCRHFRASLAYFDSYRSARLPSNLLQAQRDFFGAHTYERVDKPGVFHTEWMESDQKPAEKPTEPKTPEPHQAGE